MSSPKARAPKQTAKSATPKSAAKTAAKAPAKKTAVKKAAAKKVAAKKVAAKRRSNEPVALSGEDKVHFVKAIWEGVSKGGKDSGKASAKSAKTAKAKAPQVEILRRIPAAAPQNKKQNALSQKGIAFAAELEAAFAKGELEALSPEATQALMGAICKIYGANQESGNKYPILSGRMAVTGTDVMITCGGLLKAADLQVFELGMWQSWTGI